jgi:hypothetical protein
MVASKNAPRGLIVHPRDPDRAYFSQPLLRLASRDPDALAEHADFSRLVRQTLRPRLSAHRRSELALEVLVEMCRTWGDPDDTVDLREDWLQVVTARYPTPELLEALALVRLEQAELKLCPSPQWPQPRANHLGAFAPPTLEPYSPSVARAKERRHVDYAPEKVSRAWLKAVEVALDALVQGHLAQWKAPACLATLRCLALVTLLGHPLAGKAHHRRQFFNGPGLGLWKAVVARLEKLQPPHLWPGYVDGSFARLVIMHLRGQEAAESLYPELAGQSGLVVSAAAGAEGEQALPVAGVPVVHGPIPPATHRDDDAQIDTYSPLLLPQPVALMPSPPALEAKLNGLREEFPWAVEAIGEVERLLGTRALLGVRELMFGPLLLVGPPGAGKSRLARRLAEELALPYLPVSVGGNHDGRIFTGMTRGWAGGTPSPLLTLLLRHSSASGLVLLDEVDKIGEGRGNAPSLAATLLGLLEPETAKRWYDTFLQTTCDLSRLVFVGTANGLTGLSRPLLSRFSVVHMPEPGPQHQAALVRGITHELADTWGLPREVLPVPPEEVYAHRGRNARELRRCVLHYLYDWAREHREVGRMH